MKKYFWRSRRNIRATIFPHIIYVLICLFLHMKCFLIKNIAIFISSIRGLNLFSFVLYCVLFHRVASYFNSKFFLLWILGIYKTDMKHSWKIIYIINQFIKLNNQFLIGAYIFFGKFWVITLWSLAALYIFNSFLNKLFLSIPLHWNSLFIFFNSIPLARWLFIDH